jgi:hypothetical protein
VNPIRRIDEQQQSEFSIAAALTLKRRLVVADERNAFYLGDGSASIAPRARGDEYKQKWEQKSQ